MRGARKASAHRPTGRGSHIRDEVAYLVHDLMSPVNAIELVAETVVRDEETNERARSAAAKIRDETRVLSTMITSLLDISKADHDCLVAMPVELDMHALIDDIVDEARTRATALGIGFAIDVRLATVRADPDLLRRVLANLVDNAIRHAPASTDVEIAVHRTSGGIELRVADAGPGVPADLREQVFERFVCTPITRSNRGLGLTFCKLAVDAHAGTIWIEDRDPGATFCVQLPDLPS